MADGFMRHINIISRCARLYRADALPPLGLEGGHQTYILNICHNPGISQDKLAKIIYINKSNVTRQLAILEQTGFIRREADETDKRVMRVFPTEKAMEIYPKIRETLVYWNEYITSELTEEEKEQFSVMLGKVQEKAMQWVDERGEL